MSNTPGTLVGEYAISAKQVNTLGHISLGRRLHLLKMSNTPGTLVGGNTTSAKQVNTV